MIKQSLFLFTLPYLYCHGNHLSNVACEHNTTKLDDKTNLDVSQTVAALDFINSLLLVLHTITCLLVYSQSSGVHIPYVGIISLHRQICVTMYIFTW